MPKKKLLLVSFCDLENDPRPYKQIQALKNDFDITELALGPSEHAFDFKKVVWKEKASLWEKTRWFPSMLAGNLYPYLSRYTTDAGAELAATRFDAVIVHDIRPCPLAFSLCGDAPVIIDLHEYLPREYDDDLWWRYFFQKGTHALCAEYLPRAAACMTISRFVADAYAEEFGIRPSVVYNAPLYQDLQPSPLQEGKLRLVHHGLCARGRFIENMFDLMEKLDQRFELHLYLVGNDAYYDAMRARAESCSNIYWHKPVPMKNLAAETNRYDIGLFMLSANTFNHNNALPNKLFEFIQARLVTAVWPTNGMKHIIDKYHTGFYTERFSVDEMATALNALTKDDILRYKAAGDRAAHLLTGEISMQKIINIVASVLRQ